MLRHLSLLFFLFTLADSVTQAQTPPSADDDLHSEKEMKPAREQLIRAAKLQRTRLNGDHGAGGQER